MVNFITYKLSFIKKMQRKQVEIDMVEPNASLKIQTDELKLGMVKNIDTMLV